MTEGREEEVKEAGKNIKGMKRARFLQTASGLQQEVCPRVSGSTLLKGSLHWVCGHPQVLTPHPLPFCGMPLSVQAVRASPVVGGFTEEWTRVCR